MSLLDALLLDPVRVNFWIADREDGIGGSGTQTDPYDGSTLAKFDAVMYSLSQMGEPVCIHLGPGTFETAGYYDGIGGTYWEAKPGMRIVGSGIDVTTIKLVSAATTQRAYAIGHALSANTVGVVRVEVHDGAGALERLGRSRGILTTSPFKTVWPLRSTATLAESRDGGPEVGGDAARWTGTGATA